MGIRDTTLIVPAEGATFLQPFRSAYLQRPGVTMPPPVTVGFGKGLGAPAGRRIRPGTTFKSGSRSARP
jgi:hypothetical protein